MINSLSYKLTKQPNTISEEVFTPNKNLLQFIENRGNKDSRILVIQASNSSGKSFLLNSIAYVFNGLKLNDEELTPTLKRSIKYLIDKEHQTFDFNLSISDPDGFVIETSYDESKSEIVLKSKNNPDKSLNAIDFIQQYKLLYDIPEKPLDRIYQLLKSIKDFNNNLLNKLNPLDIKIDNILKSISEERNEETIKRIEKRINTNKQLHTSYQSRLDIEKNKLKNLNNQQNLSKLKKLLIDSKTCSDNYDIINSEFIKLKPPSSKIAPLQKNSIIIEIKKSIEKLKISNKINSLKEDIENNDYSVQIFDNLSQPEIKNFKNIFNNGDFLNNLLIENEFEKVYDSIKILNALKDYSFNKIFNTLKSNLKEDDYSLIKDLKKTLNKYKEQGQTTLIVNNLFNKNLNEILIELDELESKYSEIDKINELETSINYAIKDIINSIKEGITHSRLLSKEQKKLKKEPLENKLYNSTLNKKNLLETRKNNYLTEIQDVRFSLERGEMPLVKLGSIESINNLLDSLYIPGSNSNGRESDLINQLNQEIKKNEDLIDATVLTIQDDEAKFRFENAKQNSSFSNHQNTIQIFSNKLSYFTKYLNQKDALINDNGELNSTISENNNSYIKIIGEFVASLMGNKILYQDKTINISYIDYASKTPCFVTDEEKRIAFSDFSGGQGSSNYLKAKLNLTDDRKLIVLLDEIANMDKKSLMEVIDRLKILEQNNKLLLAILVEPVKEEDVFNITAY